MKDEIETAVYELLGENIETMEFATAVSRHASHVWEARALEKFDDPPDVIASRP